MVKRTKSHGGKPNSFAEFRTIYQRRIVTRTRCAYSRLVFATFRHLSRSVRLFARYLHAAHDVQSLPLQPLIFSSCVTTNFLVFLFFFRISSTRLFYLLYNFILARAFLSIYLWDSCLSMEHRSSLLVTVVCSCFTVQSVHHLSHLSYRHSGTHFCSLDITRSILRSLPI